ncbi:hypothetical protein BJ912DRAFT_914268 [Pholiota molesta]|nr:hypothetical protein BJ912DRAFT_914268 [Pholiota molesta]
MPKQADNAYWTVSDETLLLEHLRANAAAAGDGASFKMPTFNSAEHILEPVRTKGGPKTPGACKNKWFALRKIFRAIEAIQAQSGWTWSDDHGANITPDMEGQWQTFLKRYPAAKPYKHHGWIHLKVMTEIMPATPRGTYVFRPSQGIMGMGNTPTQSETLEGDSDQELEPKDETTEEEDQYEPPAHIQDLSSTPVRPTPGPSRKRQRAISVTPIHSEKKKTRSARDDAFSGLTKSMNHFSDNICKVLAMDPSLRTPHRRAQALTMAQTEEWMSKTDRLLFYRVLQKDVEAVDAYNALDADDLEWRKMWITQMVEDARS